MPTKKKPDALSLTETGIDLSIDALTELFRDLTSGVQAQLDAQNDEQKAEATLQVNEALQAALTKRDQLIEYRGAIEERELRIRKTVQVAEALARRYKAFVANLDSSIYQYMTEAGLERIEGTIHRFAIHKQADELQVTDTSILPKEYIIFEPWVNILKTCREIIAELAPQSTKMQTLLVACDAILSNPLPFKLDKDKIIADLTAGIEIPGAFIITNRTRLDVK